MDLLVTTKLFFPRLKLVPPMEPTISVTNAPSLKIAMMKYFKIKQKKRGRAKAQPLFKF
jgi:hypothetical protein